mgnify:CR=1 FL=1
MTKPNELVALGMAPQLAKRISDGINGAGGTALVSSVNGKTGAVVLAAADVGIKQQASIADLAAAPTEADFNGLLDALRAAGILAQPA